MPSRALPFYKLSPGGNPTVLVRENKLFLPPCGPEERAAIARALMDAGHLSAEQVGFLDTTRPLPHMEMMGGEFCVNATRSAALVFALLGLVPEGAPPGCFEGSITTSGVADPVRVRLSPAGHAMDMEAAIALPLPHDAPKSLMTECAPGEVLVRLPGITHLLLDAAIHPPSDSLLEEAAAKRAEYGLDAEEAAGVVWHVPGPGKTRRIIPVVHVAATASSVLETACGSGSLAVALLLARSSGDTPCVLHQPSGQTITVTFETPETASQPPLAWVGGPVHVISRGMTYVSFT